MRQPPPGFGQSPRRRTILWTSFIVAGSIVVVAGLAAFAAGLFFSPRTARATGVVVAITRQDAARSQRLYHPVVEFPAGGRTVRFESRTGNRRADAVRVGDKLAVVYDPGNPADARLDTPWQRWGMWLALAGLGGVLITIGVLGRRPGNIPFDGPGMVGW
jgi:hypothetical protein